MARPSCEDDSVLGSESLKGLRGALVINLAICAIEFAGGFWTGSLALISDASHNAVDCAALTAGIVANFLSRRPPDERRTFGYRRVEVLAALANGVGLWIVAAILLRAAYFSFEHPKPVRAVAMLWLAGMGLVGNAVSSLLVFSAGKTNINARAIFLHLASDVLSSAAAIAAGLIILKTGWPYADAAATVLICLIIVGASLWLIKDAVHILLEGAPSHLDLGEVRAALESIDGVREVHDLHLWSLTSGAESMSGHLIVDRGLDQEMVLESGRSMLKEKFGLTHVTLQIESEKN